MVDFLSQAESLADYTRSLRRDFHRHPELGFKEVRTSGIVARELQELGFEVRAGIAETGVVGLLEGGRPGPAILLRFDMDALPIEEQTGAEYASIHPGVMHACGHDGHTAIGLTVARILSQIRNSLSGTVQCVFQPAEEIMAGARRMMAEGLLENPRPDRALALHLWNEQPIGWVGLTSGPIMSASDAFRLVVRGRAGHGASPHLARDPVLAAAQVVVALQSIVSRDVAPLESAVVSVTQIQGGEAVNVIPDMVELHGTLRSFKSKVRQAVLDRFESISRGVAGALGCEVEFEILGSTPAVVNDPAVTALAQQVARDLFPGAPLSEDYRLMVSEDMAFILEQIPGCFLLVGSANPQSGLDAPHHHPRFDFDESCLPKAAALMAATAARLLAD